MAEVVRSLVACIAAQPLCPPDETKFSVGAGLLNLTQGRLNALLMREALKTGHVQCHFNTELLSIVDNNKERVTVLARNVETGAEKEYHAMYLVGIDGARSATRKALSLPFPGHTWPERLIATNVYVVNEDIPLWPTHYTMNTVGYGVTTPLDEIVLGKKTLWRYTFAASPDDPRSDQDLMSDENILRIYEANMPGPRPLDVEIQARNVYRIHQRLAPTMRKGNCLLAGDAAHCNNVSYPVQSVMPKADLTIILSQPFGALGLNTGLLDADAVSEALIMVLNEGRSDSVLDVYSDERRKVFQFFVDPTSTQNKLRVHSNPVEDAVANDWYFRTLQNPTAEEIEELSKPYFEEWRTNMREKAKGV